MIKRHDDKDIYKNEMLQKIFISVFFNSSELSIQEI